VPGDRQVLVGTQEGAIEIHDVASGDVFILTSQFTDFIFEMACKRVNNFLFVDFIS